MAAKAKNAPVIDRNNPALNFLSVSADADQHEQERESAAKTGTEKSSEASLKDVSIPEGYKLVPITETKTKRVQLVMKPSLHEKVKAAAYAEKLSFNDYVHRILEQATANIKVGEKK